MSVDTSSLLRIAVLQLASGSDAAANLAVLCAAIELVADDGAELVVAPEASMFAFGRNGFVSPDQAQRLDGEFVSGLSEAARRLDVTVVAGMFEAAEPRPFNTVVAIGPDGLLGHYRKQHLFDAFDWQESSSFAPGPVDDHLVIEVGAFRVGVMTCYDLRFPELGRVLVDDGATLLVVPSAWVAGPSKPEQWQALLTARAIENVCYVAGAGQPPPAYSGHSMIIDPSGTTIAGCGVHQPAVSATIDAAVVAECRARIPSLDQRRWQVVPH